MKALLYHRKDLVTLYFSESAVQMHIVFCKVVKVPVFLMPGYDSPLIFIPYFLKTVRRSFLEVVSLSLSL